MENFKQVLKLQGSAQTIYGEIAGASGARNWWSRNSEIDTRLGGISNYRFPKGGFFAKVKTTALVPNQLVEWEVVDSKHPEASGFSDLRDWVGTKIRFDIKDNGDGTSTLKFEHIGLNAKLECFDRCERIWHHFLSSLRSLLETGKGQPNDDQE